MFRIAGNTQIPPLWCVGEILQSLMTDSGSVATLGSHAVRCKASGISQSGALGVFECL